jgi:Ca2+-binding EF-hand superfamily protein
VNNDKFLDLMEMKLMMEKLEAPQTHVGLKQMIAEIDEDNDGQVSYREVRRFNDLEIGRTSTSNELTLFFSFCSYSAKLLRANLLRARVSVN